MREIVLDTETTGLKPENGDKIVEIGAVELWQHMPTGETYHQYINPKRPMPPEAFNVHGLGDDFLKDKPVFQQIANGFLDFIGDSKLVIHNASFDMGFINAELKAISAPVLPNNRAIDTLQIARSKFHGSSASLDALCRRFGIDNSARTLHGALLDSHILAQVYLELIGGRQPDLELNVQITQNAQIDIVKTTKKRPEKLPQRLTAHEDAAHKAFVKDLGENSLWAKFVDIFK